MPLRSTLVIVHYYSWWNINWRIASYRIVLLTNWLSESRKIWSCQL